MTIMMKMEVEWLQKRSNFQAHRAQIHFDFKSLVFQSRKAALIFFTKKNQFSLGSSFKIKQKQSDTYLFSFIWNKVLSIFYQLSTLSRKSKWRVSTYTPVWIIKNMNMMWHITACAIYKYIKYIFDLSKKSSFMFT